jgi:hypothetical protein
MRLQIAYVTLLFVKNANITKARICGVYKESAFTTSELTRSLSSLFRHDVLYLLQRNLNLPSGLFDLFCSENADYINRCFFSF